MRVARLPSSGEITRLAIVGTLSYAPMHGYEIRREIEARRMERWADVGYGSIYGRLRRLVDEGLVEIVRTERANNRPSRTVYGITDLGRQALVEALGTALAVPEFPAVTVDLALSYCVTESSRLGLAQLERLLEARLARLDAIAAELDHASDEPVGPQPGVSALVEDLLRHSKERVATERDWTHHVLGRLVAGDYRTPPVGALDPAPSEGLVQPEERR